jgi:hypothetical protein
MFVSLQSCAGDYQSVDTSQIMSVLKSCRESICRDVAIPATAQVASNGNVLFTLPLLATFHWRTTLSSEKRQRAEAAAEESIMRLLRERGSEEASIMRLLRFDGCATSFSDEDS